MTYDVQLTETFQKSMKALKKKYPRVEDDLLSQIKVLEVDPSTGDPIPGWNKEVWKVRVASSPNVLGSNPGPATKVFKDLGKDPRSFLF